MELDIFNSIGTAVKVAIQRITSATTTNSTGVDTTSTSVFKAGLRGTGILVVSGQTTGGTVDVTFQDSADDSTYGNPSWGATAITQVAAGQTFAQVLKVQLNDLKRYFRISTVSGASTTQTEVHATLVALKGGNLP